jgi:hypothetical protein
MAHQDRISKPTNDYDTQAWAIWYDQNPGIRRSVGAEGDEEGVEAEAKAKAEAEAAEVKAAEEAEAQKVADEKAAKEKAESEAGKDLTSKSAEDLIGIIRDLQKGAKSLEDEKAELLKDVMKKKDKLKATSTEKEGVEGTLNELQTQITELFGEEVSLEDLAEKIAEKRAAEDAALAKSGDFEKLKDRITSEHKKELEKINGKHGAAVKELADKLTGAESEIRRLLVSNNFAASTFLKDKLALTPAKAEKLYGDAFKVEDKDGKRVVVAYMGDEPLADGNGNPLGFEAAFEEIINRDPEKEVIFKPTARKGAGSGTDNTTEPGGMKKERPRGMAAISKGLGDTKAV